ncbi:TadE/TadG family type IV pilus assembly protein [Streptomyces sp. NPDC058280]|uniref:TadE/TadG family type IV pilus assembly protein n=1 Tax=Streptomyces sp. NPDC058280 TaxID=3346419 RepID=UPI0036ED8404
MRTVRFTRLRNLTRLRIFTRLGRNHDRGQTAVEFIGMLPIILGTCIMLWQAVLIGYAYTLAGNSADVAAHDVGIMRAGDGWAATCTEGARRGLADHDFTLADAECDLDEEHRSVRAKVEVSVPVLFPGFIDFPFNVTGEASSPQEG